VAAVAAVAAAVSLIAIANHMHIPSLLMLAKGKTGPLPAPGFITELTKRIMLGDTDSMSLVAPQTAGLLVDGQPPTAIRSRYYKYTFTEPGDGDTNWWKREPLRGDTPQVYLPPSKTAVDAPPHRSPPHRSWMLLLSVCGAAQSVLSAQVAAGVEQPRWYYWLLMMLCQLSYCMAVFGVLLLQDYPELRLSLGAVFDQLDAFGLRLSPDSWRDGGIGYATVFAISAAQALGLLGLGLKLRAADFEATDDEPEEEDQTEEMKASARDKELDRKLHEHMTTGGHPAQDYRQQRRQGAPASHVMDPSLFVSACLAGAMMTTARKAGDFSETLLQD
jgi:hypothetical protein